MNTKDVSLITGFELKRTLKSPAGILYMVFGLVVYGWWMQSLFELGKKASEFGGIGMNTDADLSGFKDFLSFFMEDDQRLQASLSLLENHPVILVGFFFALMFLNGLMAMIASIDQTGSDIATRHVRFMLLRTDRGSLYVGKSLAVWLFFVISMAVVCLVAAGVLLGSDGAAGHGAGSVLAYSLRMWVTTALYGLPFVALMGLASALTGHAVIGALVGFGYWLGIFLFSGIGSWIAKPAENLAYIFPTAMKYDLVFDDASFWGPALGHVLVLTALFYAAGFLRFQRRDV